MNCQLKGERVTRALAWESLGFDYIKTDFRFVAAYEDGRWSDGKLVSDHRITLNEDSPALHYGQQCFEGMKAQTAPDGRILLFRPGLNWRRLNHSARRLLMPEIPRELFFKAITETVRSNYSWIPPYGCGASLYIRPLLLGIGEMLAVKPARKYLFRTFACPVGSYYKSGQVSPLKLAVIDLDRAAARGTGNVKAGGNYAGGLLATRKARESGADEALYLDAAEKRYLEEAGSANVIVLMDDNRLVSPRSSAILPSVTRRSVMEIAEKELGMTVEERPVDLLAEIDRFREVGACGTAAVVSPVGAILVENRWYRFFADGKEAGPVMKKLSQLLKQLQVGEREDHYGWTMEVKID